MTARSLSQARPATRAPLGAALLGLALVGALLWGAAARAGEPLRVVATVPDLAELARVVGGEAVSARTLVRGPQDPHFIEPRPSFVRALHDADLFVQVGMDLERGWVPVLLRSARNPDVRPGGEGHVDASAAIAALDVPGRTADRSLGDLHVYGNPHYLTDPLNGLRVAGLLRERLAALRPAEAAGFEERYRAFGRRVLERLLGPELAAEREPEAVLRLAAAGRLLAHLEETGELERLGGWLGDLRPHFGTEAVQDHDLWAYFARRFRIRLVMELEPKLGIPPTTAHLQKVIETVRAREIPLLLASPYFDPRHARRVAERTGARVVPMAHQSGAREGAEGYLGAVEHNVRAILEAL